MVTEKKNGLVWKNKKKYYVVAVNFMN